MFQRNLLYHPTVNNYINNQNTTEPTEIEKINITTKDNIDLLGWFYNKDLNKLEVQKEKLKLLAEKVLKENEISKHLIKR